MKTWEKVQPRCAPRGTIFYPTPNDTMRHLLRCNPIKFWTHKVKKNILLTPAVADFFYRVPFYHNFHLKIEGGFHTM